MPNNMNTKYKHTTANEVLLLMPRRHPIRQCNLPFYTSPSLVASTDAMRCPAVESMMRCLAVGSAMRHPADELEILVVLFTTEEDDARRENACNTGGTADGFCPRSAKNTPEAADEKLLGWTDTRAGKLG
ncbi:hypothetical protein Hypma_014580 [Hypsizygus marmoreus]|uniref:Uncharacterized protein n=1 Tax=Hypsizygus marmoreus TaxID=39966 RepID=A0A369JE29_HYPMA|nr:hypothetical protein Hypma_014580 [Hypsizygus marmoreus]